MTRFQHCCAGMAFSWTTNTAMTFFSHFVTCILIGSTFGYVYIESNPKDQTVIEGQDAVFICDPNTHPVQESSPHIRWKHKGKVLNTTSAKYNEDKGTLYIRRVNLNDAGSYTCVASLGIDMDTKTATLDVKAKPDPPVDVQIINCLPHAAEILWQPGAHNGSPIKHYVVQFNTSSDPDHWYDYYDEVSQHTRITVVNLPPWGNYSFRMRSRNSVGLSKPSAPTRHNCHTPPDHPDTNPKEVVTMTDKKGKLIIKWTPMVRLSYNGPGFHYIVSWRRKGSIYWHKEVVTDPKQSQVEFDVDTVYELYEVRVKASNTLGESYQPAFVFLGRSGEAEPSVSPKDFRVDPDRPVQPHAAFFIWEAVDSSVESIHGKFRGYRIRYWKSSEGRHHMKESDILMQAPGHNLDVRAALRNLPAYTAIRAQVSTMNEHYIGTPSETVDFYTAEGTPSEVRKLHVEEKSADYVLLKWHPPAEANGVLKGYEIGYQTGVRKKKKGSIQALPSQIEDPSTLGARITGLQAGTKYRFYVWARTKTGRGMSSFVDIRTKLERGQNDHGSYTHSNNPEYSHTEPDSKSTPSHHHSFSHAILWTTAFFVFILGFHTSL